MVTVADVDVSKANLDVSVSEGPVVRFENTTKGITKLLKYLREQDTTIAVCESTGGYERPMVSRLPTRLECAPSPGPVATRQEPTPRTPKSSHASAKCSRMRTRRSWSRNARNCGTCCCCGKLVDQRVQELGRLDKGVSSAIVKSTKRHIAWLEKEIARLDQEYQAVLQSNVTFAQRASLYRTVPGIGPLTSAILVAYLPEMGHWNSKALTSLVGLAPWSRDSGQKRGQRSIRGGRGVVRRALYLCTWSAIRVNGELRRFYQNLRQCGKPGKVALVAVMRKLLLLLNAVARRETAWVAQAG